MAVSTSYNQLVLCVVLCLSQSLISSLLDIIVCRRRAAVSASPSDV